MIYLALSVFISSSLFVIFKLFDKYQINTFQAIVINYLTAFCCGFFFYGNGTTLVEVSQKPWIVGAIILGFLFISIFMVMATTAQRNGLSTASVASKMSVVIPVIFAVIVYEEKLSLLKVAGIILALLAVYLTTVKNDGATFNRKKLLFPLLLFLGSGVIDTAIKHIETKYLAEGEVPIFSAAVFGCAFMIGIVVAIIRRDVVIDGKTILGGIALGIPNFYSIIFLLKALRPENLGDSSTVFPINNVAIVMLSTIFGIILFKEKLIPKNWIGIVIAIISIVMIAVSA
ncbi:putative membrane protein [Kordia periserrulae]|uniref:Putative membrane protein n=1 Tax=Kordia periserrulae TaxID=701523 RepID=A0A2T6C080_9FLAO|nr:DMT family transporter [Kordia periserrulae]PTX61710.1 putative membrane protein [Kordia periserrulae]